ncbi:RimJ/RimL family protein N-acetyltransferase [Streptacidiphilus sp. MAP12-16]|uniref:GNAT family N-acetyltransferase n=1 Tax=Streptacidiphilus sp. MAP12-16 TaxID=3156300 RepID=UPI003514A586
MSRPTPPGPGGPRRTLGDRHNAIPAQQAVSPPPGPRPLPHRQPSADLLDGVGSWGVMDTRFGPFRLRPVRLPRDLTLVAAWMNDPVVTAFWELAGPAELTEHHIRTQLDGDGRSVPCLGLLDGVPIGYWEIYRADLDPLARHYPARPHDTGVHLLLGPAECRGRGLGPVLLRAVAERALRERQAARRIVAEPDVRNVPSLQAFLRAGFHHDRDLVLADKHAALLIYARR